MRSLPTPSECIKMSSSDEANKRCEARYKARVAVMLRRGRDSVPLLTEDVSFRGVFLRMDLPPALRQLVRLEVTLPDGATIRAHAVVHRITSTDDGAPGVGMQFFGLDGRERAHWESFVGRIRENRADGSGATY